ncbi:hypothetical protein DID88_004871 [Monilinia fructigena]|uniref:Uncharacterized protein n=1 Tax=Monilinia fructigena TaxID=38457 RepID=A0A395IPR9_9HELO|nr:hypothetical protein DID88_004871 [Monilinia fructigena]
MIHHLANSLSNSEALKAYLFSTEPSTNGSLGPALSITTNSAMSYQGGYSSPIGPRSAGIPGGSPQANYKYRGDSRSTGDVPKSARIGSSSRSYPVQKPLQEHRSVQTHTGRLKCMRITPQPPATVTTVLASQTLLLYHKASSGILPGNSNPDLRGMENDLRRMLKLDSPGFAGSAI